MEYEKDCCMKVWDINESLKATFKFLKRNQRDNDGNKSSTIIYLGTASLKDVNLNTYGERDLVSNIIVDSIVVALDYSVVIKYVTDKGTIISTIAYEEILNVQSSILESEKERYIEYMNNLNCFCEDDGNKYYDILNAIKDDLKLYKSDERDNVQIVFIYGGFSSRSYYIDSINIVKNLILILGGIVPVTQLNGYMIVKNPLVNKEEKVDE